MNSMLSINSLTKKILEFSFKENMGHIASALSMAEFLNELFHWLTVNDEDFLLCLGKPYGAQAYYVLMEHYGLIEKDSYEKIISNKTKHVAYAEETMGNSIGVGLGLALAHPEKRIIVNTSDASLQSGQSWEAISLAGRIKPNNLLLLVDDNKTQCYGDTSNIMEMGDLESRILKLGWANELGSCPAVCCVSTTKGEGVPSMVKDSQGWHYRKIKDKKELEFLLEEVDA